MRCFLFFACLTGCTNTTSTTCQQLHRGISLVGALEMDGRLTEQEAGELRLPMFAALAEVGCQEAK